MSLPYKFGRAYKLIIRPPGVAPIVVQLPFTLEFDIQRNSYSSTNLCKLRLYNLSKLHRNQIIHDQNDQADLNRQMQVTLFAGYGDGPNWPVVFDGNVTRAFSVRQGVNFITQIESFDGGGAYQNAVSHLTVPAGVTQQSVVLALLNDLVTSGITIGAVSQFEGTLAKGQSYSGNTVDLLRQLTNGNFFIDNGVANILFPGQAIKTNVLQINASTGLLGTPIKEQQWLLLDVLFEPKVAIGLMVNVQANNPEVYNGTHRIASVQHRGTISATVAGEATTSLGLEAGVFTEVLSKVGLP